jgi:LPXTG-site transpeptidase (sortase) family protein
MEQNTNNQIKTAQAPQFIEVTVPVKVGMSNSMFVMFFVTTFVLAFVLLSYLGLVPEGVREINATLFTTSPGDAQAVQVAGDPLGGSATSSQELNSLIVSQQNNDEQVVIKQSTLRQQVKSSVTTYSNIGKTLPIRLVISKIGVDTPISNPISTKISVLDQALLSGGVRYPGSSSLDELGNVYLFGHSTGLEIVRNKAYQAFNGIGKLEKGDEIKVQSNDKEYVYTVINVSAITADKQIIDFPTTGKILTLSTCNSFGLKADRFVVQAQFVRSYPLVN